MIQNPYHTKIGLTKIETKNQRLFKFNTEKMQDRNGKIYNQFVYYLLYKCLVKISIKNKHYSHF